MTDLNRVVLVGRLTRDAEMKFTPGGLAVSKFSIAVNRSRKVGDQWEEEASFFDATLWGRSAESLSQYLIKGKQIALDGELRQDRWEQDGQKRSKVEIIVNNLQLLGGQGQGQGGQSSGGSYASRGESSRGGEGSWGGGGSSTSRPAPAPKENLSDNFSDDIPF
ncbi:MAG: single-stranded DNA-binding protein [Spirochaetaceae bacterium]|jgi:single-strand DNA-binding protein|nr:single-stranded DNA-binding protein [Spirochaetaceae bacterium]